MVPPNQRSQATAGGGCSVNRHRRSPAAPEAQRWAAEDDREGRMQFRRSPRYLRPLTGIIVTTCLVSCVKNQSLPLPCGIAQLSWHMSEAELLRLRPNAQWNTSSQAYWEHIESCQPFFTDAGYSFKRWRGLSAVVLNRQWTVSGPAEFASTVPGFLYSCRSLWGRPTGVEIFGRPQLHHGDDWHVGLWWKLSWTEIYARYPSPQATSANDGPWWAEYSVDFSPHAIAENRELTKGDSRAESVSQYFGGFPDDGHAPDETFH